MTPVTKEFLINAIVGAGFPSISFAYRCEQAGLAEYAGDVQVPAWAWRRDVLEAFSIGELGEVYQAVRSFF